MRATYLTRPPSPACTSPTCALSWSTPIWMGNATSGLARLDAVQRSAERLMGPAEASKLQLLSHRRGVAALSCFHRIVYGSAPVAVLPLCPPRAPPQTRPSRSRGQRPVFLPPRIHHVPLTLTPSYWLNSFVPLLSRAWNDLDPSIQSITDLQMFKSAVNNSSLPLSLLSHSLS